MCAILRGTIIKPDIGISGERKSKKKTPKEGIIHMAKLKINDVVVYSDGTQ